MISLPLHESADSAKVQARRRSALESWDAGFNANATVNGPKDALGPSSQKPSNGVWDVVYCSLAPPPEKENGDSGKSSALAPSFLSSLLLSHPAVFCGVWGATFLALLYLGIIIRIWVQGGLVGR